VAVRYRPLAGDDPDQEDLPEALVRSIDELTRQGPGDILIFQSGERDIRESSHLLRKHAVAAGAEVLPLYARLSADEQMKIFQPHRRRRIILATNVAETSLTVPGIRYVIDPGHARLSRYSPRTKVQRLPIEKISRASADQRKGRCGRVAEGICIRLYSEADYEARPQYTDPEILRTNLASVILPMKAPRIGDVQQFPFIDPPDYRAIRDGYQTLHELGAIDEHNELTPLGWKLAKLPIDPRIGRMVLQAREEDCLREVLIIAAALSVQDPRERPLDRQELADAAHAQWRDDSSDFLGYLKLWDWYHQQALAVSGSRLRRLCQQNFLSFVRMREWLDIHHQLLELINEIEADERAGPSPPRRRG
jgi:ATP-dependent helicase HrpA